MVKRQKLEHLGLFDAKVPRYTSYPTAPHFKPDVGESTVESWISQLPEGGTVSLYLHIPFCRRLCWFCACRTQGTQSLDPVAGYLERLKSEIARITRLLPSGTRLSRMHWGGGTPTLLTADLIRDLADTVTAALPFAEGAEFSVEIDPNEIDMARVEALQQSGMTRASVGVQDFDPDIQKTIGRSQSYELTRDAIEMIRETGIASLNADILFGLPHQTRARMTDSVQKLLSLGPDRVALYGYAHVPWMARRQVMLPTEALPTPQQRLDLFDTARRLFLWDGYQEIGIDHFALPDDNLARAAKDGTMRRNFQGYTDDTSDVLIGLGASAISRYPQGFAQNEAATAKYSAAIDAGRIPIARGHAYQGDDLQRARMIEMLMCDFRIDAAEISERFGISRHALSDEFARVNTRFDGLLQIDAAGLFIPEAARPLTRMIARAFDSYDLSKAGHSSAI